MSAREQAVKRLNGSMDGTEWAKVDGIKGVGWALLHLADVIAEAAEKMAPARIEQQFTECSDGH